MPQIQATHKVTGWIRYLSLDLLTLGAEKGTINQILLEENVNAYPRLQYLKITLGKNHSFLSHWSLTVTTTAAAATAVVVDPSEITISPPIVIDETKKGTTTHQGYNGSIDITHHYYSRTKMETHFRGWIREIIERDTDYIIHSSTHYQVLDLQI